MNEWTIERVTLLGERMRAGASMKQLAEEFGLKNAKTIIAAVGRLRKKHPTLLPKAQTHAERGKLGSNALRGVTTDVSKPRATPVAKPPVEPNSSVLAGFVPSNPVVLTRRRGCCWPVSGAGAGTLFCNEAKALPGNYCVVHANAMHNRVPGQFRGESKFRF